jgi:hypothetical protein
MNCKNCNTAVNLNYCPNCGQPVKLKRIDGHYIIHEIEHVLHVESGMLYTIRELLIRPGRNVRRFVAENRSRLVKPVIFIILTSLVYTLVSHFFHIEDAYVKFAEEGSSATGLIFKWVQEHYGYANIIMGVFIALWLKLVFKQYDYNFFEILILLCFVMGIGMLIYAVFALMQGITHYNIMAAAGMVGFGYCTWAIGQFFNPYQISSYVKALFAYVLGLLSFMLALVLIGTLFDLLV